MEDLIKLLDENLEVDTYKIIDDEIFIYTKSTRSEATCSYCGHNSNKVHSFYTREFNDLPILGKKSNIILKNRKFFAIILNVGIRHLQKSLIFRVLRQRKLKD